MAHEQSKSIALGIGAGQQADLGLYCHSVSPLSCTVGQTVERTFVVWRVIEPCVQFRPSRQQGFMANLSRLLGFFSGTSVAFAVSQ